MKSTQRAGVIWLEKHIENCDGVYKPAKFIRPIKKVFDQNISVEEKKKFIEQSLLNKDIFEHLFRLDTNKFYRKPFRNCGFSYQNRQIFQFCFFTSPKNRMC